MRMPFLLVLAPGPLGERHMRLAALMAERLTLSGDRREGVWVLPPSGVRERLIDAMTRLIPVPHRAGAIASVPADTHAWGTAGGWVVSELGAVSLGLELSRAFNAPDAASYADALAKDHAARAPRYLDAFTATAAALVAE